jgi:N-acyl-D-amino-acid deacylase
MALNYLITNARIIDPESKADFYGSMGVKDGKIDGLFKDNSLPTAEVTIDAEGGILVPGFIDVHAHTENCVFCAEKLLAMGVTTAVSGNCGYSAADFKRFFAKFEQSGYPVNQLEQVGHGILRKRAGQRDINAAADKNQIERMKRSAADAFSAGACGLSFGLEYDPGSSGEELIELSKVAADLGRFISIHARIHDLDDLGSLREALDLAVLTGAPVIYSHLAYMYREEMLKQSLRVIAEYRERKAPVWVDSGMYTAFTTIAGSPCFAEDIFLGNEEEIKRLRGASGKYAGQNLNEEKYIEMRKFYPNDYFIYDPGNADDVYVAYSLSDVMVSTDCIEFPPGQGHPQGAATYPYFFRELVKERKQFSLMEAVRRCTLLPAQAVSLDTKGRLSSGMDADLVVLDWERLREHADFPGLGNPDAPPSGVKHVFVNGVLSIQDERRVPGVNAGYSIKR